MKIKSKFSGRCASCGGVISVGQMCEWERGEGVRHIGSCPENTPPPLVSTGANGQERITVSMGVFKKDGRIYVVKPNRDKTRVYAKEIVPSPPRITESGTEVDFETIYRPGVIYTLNEDDRWDLAEARDFLTQYARCIVCNRHLKAAKSVAEAIGPVCAKYFAHRHNGACASNHNHGEHQE